MDRFDASHAAASISDVDRTHRSQMRIFTTCLEVVSGAKFPDYETLHRFSIKEFRTFWKCFLDWSGIIYAGDIEPVCMGDDCESALFFPNLRLNYVENLLASPTPCALAQAAITASHADRPTEHLTRGELQRHVIRLAIALRRLGLQPGDRVAAILRNDSAGSIATLAVLALGATICVTAPDLGAEAILSRLTSVGPRLLIAHLAPRSFDVGTPVAARVGDVLSGLKSLERFLAIDDGRLPNDPPIPVNMMEDLVAAVSPAEAAQFEWPRFSFNHPLFIMFSSGTTGRAKAIMHGAGGTLIEHIKEHRLHCDLSMKDKLFFQTSPAWMMWNWQMSALSSGVEIVLYDGPLSTPDTLWEIAANECVTVFGTSPSYLRMCEEAGLAPGEAFDLGALRALLSTGSILHDQQYSWVRERVGSIPVQSISGGTDIIGCFVLGNPDLPVVAGECQCKSLGLDVRAFDGNGRDAGAGAIGELVCANPFPSRPQGLLDDCDGRRFHDSYFARNPGVWTHGDLIEFRPTGSARLHGRSDDVLNVHGVKVNPAEINRMLATMPEIRDAMTVERHAEQDDAQIILLLVLANGVSLNGKLAATIKRTLSSRASPAHVPDIIVQVDNLPVSHNGKPSAAALRDCLDGVPVRNRESLRNPECLEAIRQSVALKSEMKSSLRPLSNRANLVADLQRYWQSLFHIVPVGPDDNFFELGGNSLIAARLIAEIGRATGQNLPLVTLLRAPTIAQLADLILDKSGASSASLVQLRQGTGVPLFLIHSMAGTVFELRPLVQALTGASPVYAIQAIGLEPEGPSQDRVEDMATSYIQAIKALRPTGPYLLGGYSFGGLVAFEMADQLAGAGDVVDLVALIDCDVSVKCLSMTERMRFHVGAAGAHFSMLRSLPWEKRLAYITTKSARLIDKARIRAGLLPLMTVDDGGLDKLLPALVGVRVGMLKAAARYCPKPYKGRMVLFRATERNAFHCDPLPVWQRVAANGLEICSVQGDHLALVNDPATISSLAGAMSSYLQPICSSSTSAA